MSIAEICNKMYGKTIRECSNEQVYTALLALVKKVTEERKEAQERQEKENGKKVYYISAEFLIGKLLSNNLINLGLYEQISQELEENGKNIAQIEEAGAVTWKWRTGTAGSVLFGFHCHIKLKRGRHWHQLSSGAVPSGVCTE